MVLSKAIPTAIADAGATSNCGALPLVSDCGTYAMHADPFLATGQQSDRIFRTACGALNPAGELKTLPFDVRSPANEVHMVPGFKENLLSTSKFVDAGYAWLFDQDEVRIYDMSNTEVTTSRAAVLKGWRLPDENLWRIPLLPQHNVSQPNADNPATTIKLSPQQVLQANPPPVPEHINSVYDLKTKPELIRYYHAAAGFPTKPTWIAAIRNNQYKSWPGLDGRTAAKYFPDSNEMWRGHGRKIKSGLRSTQQAIADEANDEPLPQQPAGTDRALYTKSYDLQNDMDRKLYSDQTGRFPAQSFKGNQYVMVAYDMSISGSIFAEPMRNRTSGTMIQAYNRIFDKLRDKEQRPTIHILDNECSADFKKAITANEMKYQLVPPNDHRRNAAEKAIQVFKDHFVSVLCGTDEKFPMQLWCAILPHAETQLNVLRKSATKPSMSAFEHLNGPHNYDSHPFAILGSAVEIHVMPANRRTWAAHTKPGFYLGPSWEHYRCHDVWVEETRATRTGQTVFFRNKYITQPTVTAADALVRTGEDLCSALTGSTPGSDATRRAVDSLMEIFKTKAAEEQTPTDAQRVLKTVAHAQRVANEALDDDAKSQGTATTAELTDDEQSTGDALDDDDDASTCQPVRAPTDDDDGLRMTGLHVTYPSNKNNPIAPPQVTQDLPPSQNTRSRTQRLLSATEISGSCPSAQQSSRRRYPLQFLADFAGAVIDDDTGELLEYRHLIQRPKYKKDWGFSFGNEIGRLAQGMPGRNTGTNTLHFLDRHNIPADRWKDIANARIVCNVRPQKAETNRTRLTFAARNMEVDMDCGTPTASMLTIKLLLNSVISTPGAKFMAIDIKDFYLNTPLVKPEFLRMKLSYFPDDVIEHYKLKDKVDAKGNVYVKCVRGMYGLPHAGIIAQKLLETRLNEHGYFQSRITPGFWKHNTRPICFSLLVDDFGVKYTGDEHAEHLLAALRENYTVSPDWDGERYAGMTLDWDYARRQVHLSIPQYCKDALLRFGHKVRKLNHQPHKHAIPVYGRKIQNAKPVDETPKLDSARQKFVQQVSGTFLYYARAVDPTMLVALSTIASEQSAPTEATLEKTLYLLDYVASHPDAVLTYSASDMVLNLHSDASYLSEPRARSRAGGHLYMSDNAEFPENNGAILNIAQIIKNVVTSAADAEINALFINTRHAIPARNLLNEMGHKQPATPAQTDNTTALGFVTKNLNPKATKSTDMNNWYMRDKQDQEQFRYYWREGKRNDADYQTKHFCPAHHQEKRFNYLTRRDIVDSLRMRQGKTALIF